MAKSNDLITYNKTVEFYYEMCYVNVREQEMLVAGC